MVKCLQINFLKLLITFRDLHESEGLLISFFWKCIDANQIQGNLVLEGTYHDNIPSV